MTKPSDNMDHNMKIHLDSLNYSELDRLYDKTEVVNLCNMNLLEDRMMISIEFRKVRNAFVFVAFVVDNDDDENDLVQNLFQLIDEYANLERKFL